MHVPLHTVLLALALLVSPPVDDAVTTERLEPMLARGDGLLVIETFRRHPADVLPFFDGYLEGGLRAIEESGDENAGLDQFRTGLDFAKLASEAFGDDIFVRYAAGFASWSPAERRLFREGQAHYRAARKAEADDPTAALEGYLDSHRCATPLGDAWGRAMSAAGAARVEARLERRDAARRHAREAADLYERLRMQPSEIAPRRMLARVEDDVDLALVAARRAWHLVREAAPDVTEEARRETLDVYLECLEKAGQSETARTLRTAEEAIEREP